MSKLSFNLEHLVNINIEAVDTSDFPDFSKAYIDYAGIETWDGEYRELTEEELDIINSDYPDFVNACVFEQIDVV
ncbi:hypothetical protein N8Z10_01020 [bacterium]|nr:hypothetical protein [bacterium]